MSDTTTGDNRPSRSLPKDHLAKIAEVQVERQNEALDPSHVIKPHFGFEENKALWANADERLRHGIVYGMVMYDGAISKGMSDIARFFGVKKATLEPYAETFEMARAALKLKIQRNQISLGLQREDNAQWKFNLQKQFAEQVSEPAHEGVETTEGQAMKSIFENLSVVETHRDENGNTTQEPTTLKLVQKS